VLARSELTPATTLDEEQRSCWHRPEFSIVAQAGLLTQAAPLRGEQQPRLDRVGRGAPAPTFGAPLGAGSCIRCRASIRLARANSLDMRG